MTFILRQKYTRQECVDSLHRTVRSALFVAGTAGSVFAFFCLAANATGRISFTLNMVTMPILAGLAGILIENPRRRSALALFAANLASEIAFNRAVHRGWVTPVPNGEVYLFALSLATFVSLSARHGRFEKDPIGTLCEMILGKLVDSNKVDQNNNRNGSRPRVAVTESLSSILKLACKSAAIGYAATTALSLALKPKSLFSLATLKSTLMSQRSRKFSLFLGSLTALFKLTNYASLRFRSDARLTPRDYFVAALVAGASSYVFKSPTLTLYMFWRAVQAVGSTLAEQLGLSEQSVNFSTSLLFAVGCGHVFYSLPHDQQFVRKSYLDFLDRVTDGNVYTFNKLGWDICGTRATADLKNLKPLDYRYLSRKYVESVLVWLI